jgi:hypothetical protein
LLFILFSRVFDTFLAGYRIPSIAYVLTGIVALFGGQLLHSFSPKISKLWLVFTALITLSAFFSIWRGGSIQMLANVWSKALLVYFLIVSLTRTIDQCARAVRTIGWAVGVLVLLSLTTGTAENGRMFLEQGKFQNPNDLAQSADRLPV